MNFQLSPDVDTNKIFLVNSSDLGGRIDPNYIKNISAINNINTPYPLVPLGSLLRERPMYGANEIAIDGDRQTDVRYIRITDIDDQGNLQSKDWKTAKNIQKKYALNENDILFARSGATAGKAFIYKKEHGKAIFAGYMIRFRFDETRVNPHFIFYYILLSRYRSWVKAIQRPSGQPNINSREFKSFLLPLPSLEIQNYIVEIMQSADVAKRKKEVAAQQCLDTIDNYISQELGVELPEEKKHTLQGRMFTRRLSEVSGERLDPLFHMLNKQDQLGKFNFFKLKEIASIRKGDSITSYDVVDGNIPVIAGGQTSPYTHNIANSNGDVITVSASGAYAGYVWYHENPIFASDCTIVSSKSKNNLNNKYLFEYLKIRQQDIYNLQQGSGQPHIYPSDLERIKIPVPPIEKQIQIANYITGIRTQAKQLQQQSKAELNQAKKEVEAIILAKNESTERQD